MPASGTTGCSSSENDFAQIIFRQPPPARRSKGNEDSTSDLYRLITIPVMLSTTLSPGCGDAGVIDSFETLKRPPHDFKMGAWAAATASRRAVVRKRLKFCKSVCSVRGAPGEWGGESLAPKKWCP